MEKNVKSFSKDTKKMGGYIYTQNKRLSSLIANTHQTETTLKLIRIRNKKIIDAGCGDGTYTQEWFNLGKPKSILAFDPSVEGIKAARKNNLYKKNVSYVVGNIYSPPVKRKYDVVIVRGVLHHLYEPQKAVASLSKIGSEIILIEPNGYNPILKIIEKVSKYHIDHEEKSFFPFVIDRWVENRGGIIIKRKFAAIVPFFCPDWMAKFLHNIEPLVESLPIVSWFLCSNYYLVYKNP